MTLTIRLYNDGTGFPSCTGIKLKHYPISCSSTALPTKVPKDCTVES